MRLGITDLDNDHRKRIDVGLHSVALAPAGDRLEELRGSPTEGTSAFGSRSVDRRDILRDRREAEVREERVAMPIDQDVWL